MLSKKELLLMTYLRQNARETLTRLSRKTSVPISTIYDKLKQYENGIIKKHTSLLDFNRLGYTTRATIMLKVDKEIKNEIREFLVNNRNINSIFKINNGFDFLLESIFKEIKDLEDFVEKLEDKFKIKNKQVYYIIEDIKREGFMTDPNILNVMG